MKEQISSVEYATNWYGEEWEKKTLESISSLIATGGNTDQFLSILKTIEQEVDITLNSFIQNLIHSGLNLTSLIDQELFQLNQQVKEQIAALFLREKFGPPEDPLVSVVFADLAQREVLARHESMATANASAALINKFEKEILLQLQLLVAQQINLLEKEVKQYQQAKKDGELISQQTPEIATEMSPYQKKFEHAFTKFESKKHSLEKLYQLLSYRLTDKEDQHNNKQVVLELAKQNTSPTQLNF
jgi:hypothetical protein